MQIVIAAILIFVGIVLFFARKSIKNEDIERASNVGSIVATLAGVIILAFYTAALRPDGSQPTQLPLLTNTSVSTSGSIISTETLIAQTETLTPTATWTPIPTLTVTETLPPPTATRSPIAINESRNSTNYDGKIILTVETIEIRPNNRMRWHISFWNTDNRSASMAFGDKDSYAVDEYGFRYDILSMNPSNFINLGVQAGVKSQGWLEFNLPTNNARNFRFFLVRWSFGFQQLRYDDPIEFALPEPLLP